MRFRKKSVEITAIQWDGDLVTLEHIRDVCPGAWILASPLGLCIPIDNGTQLTAHLGDWIIAATDGELSICPPDIFDATYEQIASAEDY